MTNLYLNRYMSVVFPEGDFSISVGNVGDMKYVNLQPFSDLSLTVQNWRKKQTPPDRILSRMQSTNQALRCDESLLFRMQKPVGNTVPPPAAAQTPHSLFDSQKAAPMLARP